MSIEKVLADLTAALTAQTAVMEKMIAASGGKPAAAAATAPAKAAATAAKANPKGPTVEESAAAVTAYMKTGDAQARAVAKINVGKIIEHFGSDRFTTIPEDRRVEALAMLATFVAGDTPTEIETGEDGPGSDDDSMV